MTELINISTPLTEMAARQPDTPAIIFPTEGRTITFKELDEQSNRLAAGFIKNGIQPGTRTALLVPPSPELFAITFALFKAGIVPVFIDPGIGAKNMKGCLTDSAPKAFIGIPKAHIARIVLGWGKETVRTLVRVGGNPLTGGISLKKIEQDGKNIQFRPAETGKDEIAAILFTSGSTGPPKGAVYTHGNFAAQVKALKEVYNIMPGEIDLPTFPLFALFAPALGMTALIPEMDFTKPGSVDSLQIINTGNRYKATTMFGSPALLNRVGRYGAEKKLHLESVKRVISAGAPVPAAVLQRFREILPEDAEIFTPYGATEALPVSSISSREILSETQYETAKGKGICVGQPIPGLSLAIIPISDKPVDKWSGDLSLATGEIGEIAVSGEQVTKSYFENPQATRMAKIQGEDGKIWHRMGDTGYLDEKGRLWFCGRKSHRVVTASGTLFTIPVEGIFNSHPDIFRTALVGIGEPGNQKPVLCVELEKGVKRNQKSRIKSELIEIARKSFIAKDINIILFHPKFPVDIRHNAKIFREKLATWAAEAIS